MAHTIAGSPNTNATGEKTDNREKPNSKDLSALEPTEGNVKKLKLKRVERSLCDAKGFKRVVLKLLDEDLKANIHEELITRNILSVLLLLLKGDKKLKAFKEGKQYLNRIDDKGNRKLPERIPKKEIYRGVTHIKNIDLWDDLTHLLHERSVQFYNDLCVSAEINKEERSLLLDKVLSDQKSLELRCNTAVNITPLLRILKKEPLKPFLKKAFNLEAKMEGFRELIKRKKNERDPYYPNKSELKKILKTLQRIREEERNNKKSLKAQSQEGPVYNAGEMLSCLVEGSDIPVLKDGPACELVPDKEDVFVTDSNKNLDQDDRDDQFIKELILSQIDLLPFSVLSADDYSMLDVEALVEEFIVPPVDFNQEGTSFFRGHLSGSSVDKEQARKRKPEVTEEMHKGSNIFKKHELISNTSEPSTSQSQATSSAQLRLRLTQRSSSPSNFSSADLRAASQSDSMLEKNSRSKKRRL